MKQSSCRQNIFIIVLDTQQIALSYFKQDPHDSAIFISLFITYHLQCVHESCQSDQPEAWRQSQGQGTLQYKHVNVSGHGCGCVRGHVQLAHLQLSQIQLLFEPRWLGCVLLKKTGKVTWNYEHRRFNHHILNIFLLPTPLDNLLPSKAFLYFMAWSINNKCKHLSSANLDKDVILPNFPGLQPKRPCTRRQAFRQFLFMATLISHVALFEG